MIPQNTPDSYSTFQDQLKKISHPKPFHSLIVKEDGSLGEVNFFRSLWEKFKGILSVFGCQNMTNRHLVELKIIDFLIESKEWIKAEECEMIKNLAERMGITPSKNPGDISSLSKRNHPELTKLVETLCFQTNSSSVNELNGLAAEFYLRHASKLTQFSSHTSLISKVQQAFNQSSSLLSHKTDGSTDTSFFKNKAVTLLNPLSETEEKEEFESPFISEKVSILESEQAEALRPVIVKPVKNMERRTTRKIAMASAAALLTLATGYAIWSYFQSPMQPANASLSDATNGATSGIKDIVTSNTQTLLHFADHVWCEILPSIPGYGFTPGMTHLTNTESASIGFNPVNPITQTNGIHATPHIVHTIEETAYLTWNMAQTVFGVALAAVPIAGVFLCSNRKKAIANKNTLLSQKTKKDRPIKNGPNREEKISHVEVVVEDITREDTLREEEKISHVEIVVEDITREDTLREEEKMRDLETSFENEIPRLKEIACLKEERGKNKWKEISWIIEKVKNKDFLLRIMDQIELLEPGQGKNVLMYVNDKLKNDEDLMLACARKYDLRIICIYFRRLIYHNADLIGTLALEHGAKNVIQNIPQDYSREHWAMMPIVEKCGIESLSHMDEDFLDHVDFLSKAIDKIDLITQGEGVRALKYASKKIKNDPRIMLSFIKKCGLKALKYAGPNAASIIETLILNYGLKEVVQDIPTHLFKSYLESCGIQSLTELQQSNIHQSLINDPLFMIKAIEIFGIEALDCKTELIDNPNFMGYILQRYGLALKYASPRIRNWEDLVMLAVENNGLALEFAGIYREDFNIVLAALKQNLKAFPFVSKHVIYEQFYMEVLIEGYPAVLQCINPDVKLFDNAEWLATNADWQSEMTNWLLTKIDWLIDEILPKNEMVLSYLPESLLDAVHNEMNNPWRQPEFIAKEIQEKGISTTLPQVHSSLKKNLSYMKTLAIDHGLEALKYVSHRSEEFYVMAFELNPEEALNYLNGFVELSRELHKKSNKRRNSTIHNINKRSIWEAYFKHCPDLETLSKTPEIWRSTGRFMDRAIEIWGIGALKDATPYLMDSYLYIQKIVQKNGLTLQYASNSLKSKKKLVEFAIAENPDASQFSLYDDSTPEHPETVEFKTETFDGNQYVRSVKKDKKND